MEEEHILWQLEHISKNGFKHQRLHDFSYSITTGVTAIIGQSGAGKTTLLNLLSKQELPDKGQLHNYLPKTACPFYIVPQDFGLWPHLNTRDHLLKVMPTESKEKAEELLEAFDLQERSLDYAEFLSQGEASRLCLARALATGAQVLIMDEPLANVDNSRKHGYWEILLKLIHERNGSLIFSTHEPSEVLAYADHVICLHQGKLIDAGPVETVYDQPSSPETSRLLGPGNWLEDNNPLQAPTGFYRPERISLKEDNNSKISVTGNRFFGSYHRSQLSIDNQSYTLFHNPADRIKTAMKVAISFLLLCLISCSPQESTLSFTTVSSWNIPAAGQKLPGPRAITCGNNDEVIVLDDAGRILVYDPSGKLKRSWNMPDTYLGHPEGVTVFKDGKIAIADTHFARVVVFHADGTEAFRFGSRGDKPGQFYSPVGITLDAQENIYVCEYGFNDRVQKFTKDGKFLVSFGKSGIESGNMQRASDMVWHQGLLYLADAVNNRIQVFKDNGEFLHILKNENEDIPFYLPYDIDLGPQGNLWIIEYANCRLTKTTLSGEVLGTFGSPGTEVNQFKNPWGLGVSQDGTIYVADTANRRIIILKN